MSSTRNLLTVDCEEWFVAEALAGHFSRSDWDRLPSAVVKSSRHLLDVFHRYDVRATWFMLGWVAERNRELMREIIGEGHEIACHSYYHRRVDRLEEGEFREDTRRAVEAIEAACGRRPVGYRAPSWSINPTVKWAFEVLAELGFEYDSSIFPIKHDIYGVPGGPRHTFKIRIGEKGALYEIPASTYRLFGKNIPVAGGGHFRHSPYWYSRAVIRRLNENNVPAVVYIHPWELDSNLPRVNGLSPLQRFRTYGSTSILSYKFERLLKDFAFMTMGEHIAQFKRQRIGFM